MAALTEKVRRRVVRGFRMQRDGRIACVRYVLPRHKAANWGGPGRGRKSTRPGANGVVELSPFEFLDRLADLVPPPVSPARGPPTDWGELVQAHFRPGDLSGTDRRAARDRHPQPLTGSHATVPTGREKSGFKAGSSRPEKSGLERG